MKYDFSPKIVEMFSYKNYEPDSKFYILIAYQHRQNTSHFLYF